MSTIIGIELRTPIPINTHPAPFRWSLLSRSDTSKPRPAPRATLVLAISPISGMVRVLSFMRFSSQTGRHSSNVNAQTGEESYNGRRNSPLETGSVYPALHRLERRGWVMSEWKLTQSNLRAKYYRLTAAGRKQLAAERARWEQLVAAIADVMQVRRLIAADRRAGRAFLDGRAVEEAGQMAKRPMEPGCGRRDGDRVRMIDEVVAGQAQGQQFLSALVGSFAAFGHCWRRSGYTACFRTW